MNILAIGLEDYIKYHLKNEIGKSSNISFYKYGEFIGINYIEKLTDYENYDTLIIGIDKLFYINELEFDIFFNVLNNIVYLLKKTNKIKKVIFLSSYGVYKEKEDGLYKENDEILPGDYLSSIYLLYENMLRVACSNNEINLVIVRVFNLYGLFQDQDYVVMSIIKQFFENEHIFIGDARKKRDYIYIKDFTDYIKILIFKSIDENYSVYNLGTGSSYSIKDIISTMEKITGKKKKVIFNAEKLRINLDYDDVKADINKSRNGLKFSPKYNLEEGLNELVELYKISRGRLL